MVIFILRQLPAAVAAALGRVALSLEVKVQAKLPFVLFLGGCLPLSRPLCRWRCRGKIQVAPGAPVRPWVDLHGVLIYLDTMWCFLWRMLGWGGVGTLVWRRCSGWGGAAVMAPDM